MTNTPSHHFRVLVTRAQSRGEGGTYELVAGGCRFSASKLAKRDSIGVMTEEGPLTLQLERSIAIGSAEAARMAGSADATSAIASISTTLAV
jgi:hypothetical protein